MPKAKFVPEKVLCKEVVTVSICLVLDVSSFHESANLYRGDVEGWPCDGREIFSLPRRVFFYNTNYFYGM